jgi:hypothetical protein
VSEIFELERALVDAARRHYRRGARGAFGRARRRVGRPLRIAAVPLALIVLVAVVIAIARTAAPPREERPAATPAATPVSGLDDLRRAFAIFRRPRVAADALPSESIAPRRARALTDQSRLAAHEGDMKLWVFPVVEAAHGLGLCTWMRARRGGSGGCTWLETAESDDHPMTMSSPPRRGKPGLFAGIFRDDIDDVRITLRDGTILRRPVKDNAVLVPLSSAMTSWAAPAGMNAHQSLDPDPNEKPAARGCPDLEPPRADATAQATRAALAATARLYPGRTDPQVVSVKPLKPTDRGGIAYQTCGAQTASRALIVELRLRSKVRSASLSQGTLLVGQIKGRMTVWQQLH